MVMMVVVLLLRLLLLLLMADHVMVVLAAGSATTTATTAGTVQTFDLDADLVGYVDRRARQIDKSRRTVATERCNCGEVHVN